MNKWTILIYMSADASLLKAAEDDILELREGIRSVRSREVTVVVQLDTPNQVSRRYVLQPEDPDRAPTDLPQNLDAGDPKVLEDFLRSGFAEHEGEKKALILWNHAGGWQDTVKDFVYRRPRRLPSALMEEPRDSTSRDMKRDYLTDAELRQAIEASKQGPMDILGFDACLMGMVEIAAEMRSAARVMVASETKVPIDGWPYRDILAALSNNAQMPADDFAKVIVEKFKAYYGPPRQGGTLAAVRLSSLTDLLPLVGELVGDLQSRLGTHYHALRRARSKMLTQSVSDYVDLASALRAFDEVFHAELPTLSARISKVSKALDSVFVARENFGTKQRMGGLSMFFPDTKAGSAFLPSYRSLTFATQSGWSTFLEEYLKRR